MTLGIVFAGERQLTSAPHGHVLTNVNVWSLDSRWIAYDIRGVDSLFDGTRIEQVNVDTGEVQRLYESKNGAACGVVTYHPREPKLVFIHGPEHPTADWNYGASRRHGVIVDAVHPDAARPMDAMNYAPPFTPGALRGGSHVHVFSPDGTRVSFTYEDEVLARLGPEEAGEPHDINQRNVGVAFLRPARATGDRLNGDAAPSPRSESSARVESAASATNSGVRVARSHPRNHDGDLFSVLVTRTVNGPRPGSDEISKAYEEGWIGNRAIAFLGNVIAADGSEHAELFVADLPDDLTRADVVPLQGTVTRRPAPPRGVTQRRLTFTVARMHPGVVTSPRHWVRASPDGTQLAFLMKDDAGVVQLWTIAPGGGAVRQVTRNPTGFTSAFTWSPDGRRIAHTMDGSVCTTDVATGRTERLTVSRTEIGSPEPLACVFSPDGRHIAFTRRVTAVAGPFSQIFIVTTPSP